MANRYVPRTPPSDLSALEVNRRFREMYPDIAVGEESGISPDVMLNSIDQTLAGYRGEIQDQRKFAVGAGKMGYIVGKDMGWIGKKATEAASPAGKAVGTISGKSADQAAIDAAMKKAKGSVAKKKMIAGAKDLGLGMKVGAENILSKVGMAQPHSLSVGASTAAKIGAAVPPLLLATLAAKAIGSTRLGKQWNKKTNRWLKKATGTGRTKNLLSPWKWRL